MSDRYADIETKLGIIRARFTDRDHVYAACAVNVNIPGHPDHVLPLTINGVAYSCHVDLFRNGEGEFAPRNYHCISGSRIRGTGNYNRDHLSDAARRQVEKIIVPALQNWARSHQRLMYRAEAEACQNRIESLDRKIADLQKEIDALTTEQTAWAQRLSEAETMLGLPDDETKAEIASRTGRKEERS